MGGSKNTLWQCADRNTCLGSKPIIVLSNLIISEIKYSVLKKEKVLKYIKQFLNDDELNYVKNNNQDDIKTLVRFVAEKINNRKRDKMFPNFNDKTKKFVDMYDVMDEKEKVRLEFQKNLTRNEDLRVFEPILKGKNDINILDVGCNNGNLITDRIESLKILINKLIGIDSNKEIIEEANEINGSDVYHFYYSDVEKDSFEKDIEKIMNDTNIEGFDLVCVSMLLLHLSKPYAVLKKLRKIMNTGATILIRDIDDSLAIIYPDENKLFEKAMKISSEMETTGYRNIGRQIPTLLKKSGFNNILMHPESVNTLGMNHDERESLFNTVFSFIMIDLPLLMKKYPSEKKYREYYDWMKSVYEDMEKAFQSDDLFYQMGNVLFTAKK